MGNFISSCATVSSNKPTTANFFDSQGHFQRVELPVKAAELMLEAPGSVVCPVDELQRTRGIWALRADEDLEAGKFYLMFPANRVYCKVSEMELELIKTACRQKGTTTGPKVFPNADHDQEEVREGVSSKLLGENTFPTCRLGYCKQWKPMLEPIYEVA
ncbi:hypothetical protein FRX31_034595 [Thalictrum thalictroides]|uniref:Uncharacterized protein n=1 Tax=Thalictrum thalictroides TaxID=46969 RepID=A0A7J6UTN1_THATH|nr:hypothetical protein FRX31_034595 [Thalictrum thalictroides]